jgi:geranylgeranyl pyrophosphate synthase
MEKAPGDAAPLIEKIWAEGQAASPGNEIKSLLELMRQHGTLDETRELAKAASRAALEALPSIDWGTGEDGAQEGRAVAAMLKEIPEVLLARTH